MTYEEMAKEFQKAEVAGYGVFINNDFKCDLNCDNCPSKQACECLTGGCLQAFL